MDTCLDVCCVLCVADGRSAASGQESLPQRRSISPRTRTNIFQVDAVVQGFHEIEKKAAQFYTVWLITASALTACETWETPISLNLTFSLLRLFRVTKVVLFVQKY